MTAGRAWAIIGILAVGFGLGVIYSEGRPNPDCEYHQHAVFTVDREWICEDPE